MSSFGFIISKALTSNKGKQYLRVHLHVRSVQDRVNAIMNLRISQIPGSFLTSRGPVSFSGKTLLHGFSYTCAGLQLEIYILAIINFRQGSLCFEIQNV